MTEPVGRRIGMLRNERGIALLIVILATTLLIALVVEFAYGTRVSLRGAVNFRDSMRAYYLARSGVNFAGALLSYNLKNRDLQDNLEQRDWQVVPVTTAPDTVLRVRWEDEGGKLDVRNVAKGTTGYDRVSKLFEVMGISQDVLDRMSDWELDQRRQFTLLTQIHQFLNDADFAKVQDDLTVFPGNQVDVNTAPAAVLQSLGMDPDLAQRVVAQRINEPFAKMEDVTAFLGQSNTMAAGALNVTSNTFRVDSYATVGGYTKQIEAVITRSATGFTVQYWRSL